MPTGKIVGIDGCRAGWLAVSCDSNELKMGAANQSIDIQVFATIEALWSAHHDASLLLVDMPIGLLEGLPRQVEPAARKGLRGRAASVFSVPCRQAVYAGSYEQACEINAQQLGKRLSIQAWHICPKIRQLDRFLQICPEARERMLESHPELAFARVKGQPLTHSKKQAAGQLERLAILSGHWPAVTDVYHQAVGRWRRSEVQRDDILDAMVLLLTLRGRWATLLETSQRDQRGLAINLIVPVGYAQPV